MKFETTYTELASIYASIAKADAKYQELLNADRAYTDASDALVASGFLLSKDNEISEVLELRENAKKALLRTYSKLVDLLVSYIGILEFPYYLRNCQLTAADITVNI